MFSPLKRSMSVASVVLTAASLSLLPAAPASATAPHGSAKKVTEVATDVGLCGIPSGLTYTVTYVNISQQRPQGTATPGSVTETWSNGSAFVQSRNANLAIVNETQVGDIVTLYLLINGLQSRVTTSDGPQPALTSAGHLEQTVVLDVSDPENPELVSFDTTFRGKEASADFCAVVDATLG